MSLLDRNYSVEIYLKDGRLKKSGVFEVYTTDANIFNIYVILKDNTGAIIPNADLASYTVKLYVVRPDLAYKEVACAVDGSEDRLVVDLGADVVSTAGNYKIEFRVEKDTEVLTSSPDSFKVKPSAIDGLTQTYSLSAASLKPMIEEQNAKIDDLRFDGKVLKAFANGEVVRKIYLDKANIPKDEEQEEQEEAIKPGKGIRISKNRVVSLDMNVLKALIKEIIKEGK